MFCGAFDEWCCKYAAAFAGAVPRVTYFAAFDHAGPPVKTGAPLDTSKLARKGPVRVVAVHVAVKDDAEGNALAQSTRETFGKWGCIARGGDVTMRFDCGGWSVTAEYHDINHQVIVEAAMKGFSECGGA
jgi:hypothetical protein